MSMQDRSQAQDERGADEGPNYALYALALAIIVMISIIAFVIFGAQAEQTLSTFSHSV